MRKFLDAEITQHTMKLQQMGAKVQVINSKLCYVNFDISGFKIQYVYNVNKKGNYFLERIKPYPMPIKEFELEQDVIDIIEVDVEQFKSALKSHNIEEFINISRTLNKTLKKFEDLFLYYNIPGKEIDNIVEKLESFEKEIDDLETKSERLYFKKEPENL
ncbi:MAG: hypothetical protein JJE29_04680 [Peptostreptococcaceae bacterium]|nr:hypothetical protein [Peptostreptococcaceae bacterium]